MSDEEIYYPSLADIVLVARKIGAPVRDAGLIESAAARPQTSILGQDAYPDIWTKAAALLHSLVSNHPFTDGNKRVGWVVAVTFLYHNGAVTSRQLATADQDAAYLLVMALASGEQSDLTRIAAEFRKIF